MQGPSTVGRSLLPALAAGLGDATRRTPLVVLLWQVNLLFGAILGGLAATALVVTLDGSWYTRSLLRDLDPTVFFVLFSHDAAAFKLLGATAVTLVILYLAGWLLLHGAVVASVCGEENLGVRDSLRAGAGVLPLFLRIAAVATLVFAVLVGGSAVTAAYAMRLAREAAAPALWEACAAFGVGAASLAWIFCAVVHDHARIRCFARGSGAIESYAWAMSFVTRGGRRALPLGLVLFAVSAALAVFYQAVASRMHADWMTGVVVSILWGQAMLLARALLRVWTFASEARLQGEAGGG